MTMPLLCSACSSGLSEQDVRDRLGRWLSPGKAMVFSQTDSCTAAAFHVRNTAVKSSLVMANDPAIALFQLKRVGIVGLSVPGMTPAQATEIIATSDFPTAVAVIRVGQSAQPCMEPDFQQAIYNAVHDPKTVLILDAESVSLIVLDRTQKRIFFITGASH
ncbi:hypothetical protein [Rhodalgimonas zhirmunskyi]|nr:hypothetical protein [Rhodoalgimonas zhirmunskyi]